MKNNTETIIYNFNINIDINKKYNISQLTKLLSNTFDKYNKKIKLTHEIPLLFKKIKS